MTMTNLLIAVTGISLIVAALVGAAVLRVREERRDREQWERDVRKRTATDLREAAETLRHLRGLE